MTTTPPQTSMGVKNHSLLIADWTADALAFANRINERLRPTAGKILRNNRRHLLNDNRCLSLAGFDDVIQHHIVS